MTAPADAKSTQAENERICSELLGWELKRAGPAGFDWWELPSSDEMPTTDTPTFTTWHDCGLILEAFEAKHFGMTLHTSGKKDWNLDVWEDTSRHETGPLAVRAAALSYLRSLER